MSKPWGYHLIVDAADCNDNINKPEIVKNFLEELVVRLKMHPIGKPTVVYVDWDEGRGVSGVQLITTSTITFHGDDEGNCLFIDVFSCKEYEQYEVLALISAYFQPLHIDYKWILRDAPNSVRTEPTGFSS